MPRLVPIGIAAKELGVHPDTLRRWEREGRIDPAERTPGGRRRYDLGALLITQQPGSIPVEILSQGDNWFIVEDEIIGKRDELVASLQQRLHKKTSNETVFSVRWQVT